MNKEKKEKGLRDFPKVATEIACFIGNFNKMESIVHLVFAQSINDNIGFTHAFLSRWNSFTQKLEIIVEVSKLNAANIQAQAILKHKQNIDKLSKFRNLLAHSVFAVDDGNNVTALSYLVSKRNPKATIITLDLINSNRKLLRQILDDLIAVVRHGEVNGYRRPT